MPPNIVLILADDLGWRDLGCYGSPFYETPHIDLLAAEGVRFTDAYAACPVCSPTRASILTGKYPATVGITDWIDFEGVIHPARGRLTDAPYLKALPRGEHTLASALAEAGYATWHVGKWHLGGEGSLPTDHGFRVNIGGCAWGSPGREGYFSPWGVPALRDVDVPPGTHLDDYLAEQAVALIEGCPADRPFFLNLWPYLVHIPCQAKAETVKKYEEKARRLGLDAVDPFEEGEPFPTEHKRHLRVVRRRVQSDPVYAAMVEHLDDIVGRILAALERTGRGENTVVIFTSDNGGLATAEGSPTSNAPLAEGKGWMYEGGTREPLIVRGAAAALPGVTASGSILTTPISSPDFYPTILEMAGLPPLPAQHRDGVSFAPLLRGEEMPERPLFWHYPHYGNQGGTPGSSLRCGDHKVIEFFEDGRLELYNLREDVAEAHNLAAERPDLAARLHGMLVGWRERVEARLPERNEGWRG